MNDRSQKLLRIVQLMGDMILLNALFGVAAWLRFDDLRVENQEYYNYYIQLLVFFNLSWALIAVGFRIYDLRPGTEIRTSLGRTFNALAIHLGLFAVLAVTLKGDYYSRLFLIYFYVSFGVSVLVVRLLSINMWRSWLRRGKYARTVWLIGSGPAAEGFTSEISLHPEYGYRLMKAPHSIEEAKEMLATGKKPDEIFCAFTRGDLGLSDWYILAETEGLRFRFLPELQWTNLRHARVDLLGDVPVLIPRTEPLSYWHSRLIKRLFDVVVTALLLVTVLWWLLPILALIIRIDSPGNPIFVQRRSGINGQEFPCYKLRTMKINHGREGDQAVAQDSRVTRVGRTLRRYNLDELPQFINVLFNQMSIVGPRPHMLEHTENYRQRIDEFMVRHWIKPGITGLAQAMGLRGETKDDRDMADRVKADVYYLEHWSILLDVKVFFWTAWNMLTGSRGGV